MFRVTDVCVVFTCGRRYSYHGVPAGLFESMKLSFAKGEFFNRESGRNAHAALAFRLMAASSADRL